MTEITTINLFYPLLFIFLIVVAVIIGLVIRGKSSDKKDTTIFTKSSDNAKEITLDNNKVHMDTTGKIKGMHDNVVKVDFTSNHEHEFHQLEVSLKNLKENVNEINAKVDELIKRIIILEKK